MIYTNKSYYILLDTVSANNQVYIPSDLNTQHTPISKSSIVVTHNGWVFHSLFLKIITMYWTILFQ